MRDDGLVYSPMELKGKTAIITGASGVLGGAITKALAKAGCNCVCHYHTNKEAAEKVLAEIEGIGVKGLIVKGDLRKESDIKELFRKSAELGMPQILVNSASIFKKQGLGEITFENCQEMLGINLTAPILISQMFGIELKKAFENKNSVLGKIINMTDVGGVRPWAEYAVYCCSKAGLIGATKAMAKELSPSICVNSVAVGLASWPGDFGDEEKKRQLSFVPMGRIAEMKEVGAAVVFLLENDYITGQVLNVDGGRCI